MKRDLVCEKCETKFTAAQDALAETKKEADRLRAALQLFILAGFGNSTDFHKQMYAYHAAVEALD